MSFMSLLNNLFSLNMFTTKEVKEIEYICNALPVSKHADPTFWTRQQNVPRWKFRLNSKAMYKEKQIYKAWLPINQILWHFSILKFIYSHITILTHVLYGITSVQLQRKYFNI